MDKTLLDKSFSALHPTVLVIGLTGSGKSSFIQRATGDENAQVGHDLTSETRQARCHSSGSPAFMTDNVYFDYVDTPGFSDTDRADLDVLEDITNILQELRSQNQHFLGIILIHRISDDRITGSSQRVFEILKHFCGRQNYNRIAILTTFWDCVEQSVGESRNEYLRMGVWKDIDESGGLIYASKLGREEETKRKVESSFLLSARAKTRGLSVRDYKPIEFAIEAELVNNKLPYTQAGRVLAIALNDMMEKFWAAIKDFEDTVATCQNQALQEEMQRQIQFMKQKIDGIMSIKRRHQVPGELPTIEYGTHEQQNSEILAQLNSNTGSQESDKNLIQSFTMLNHQRENETSQSSLFQSMKQKFEGFRNRNGALGESSTARYEETLHSNEIQSLSYANTKTQDLGETHQSPITWSSQSGTGKAQQALMGNLESMKHRTEKQLNSQMSYMMPGKFPPNGTSQERRQQCTSRIIAAIPHEQGISESNSKLPLISHRVEPSIEQWNGTDIPKDVTAEGKGVLVGNHSPNQKQAKDEPQHEQLAMFDLPW